MGEGFKLFRTFRITVHLHWTWFLFAAFFTSRDNGYTESPMLWSTIQCLALFGLLLIPLAACFYYSGEMTRRL